MRSFRTLAQIIGLLAVLLIFFTSIELMGDSFKLMGSEFAQTLLETTANPFVGLFVGILATSLVQSSSTVTTMTVTLVAGGGLTIPGAIPIIMGANIGTSVTNTIVSLCSVSRKDEFGRAMAGATVHDFFNLLAVAVLFPIELLTRLISRTAALLTSGVYGLEADKLLSPVKVVVDPIASFIISLSGENGILVLGIGLLLLFISLRYLVTLLKALILGRSEKLLHKYIFGAPAISMLFGVLLTFFVQSSSITTSLTVPLVAAGLVTVQQIFPFVLGANVGTTITALLAALAAAASGTPEAGIAALTVAFAHLTFNVFGILIFFPIKKLRNIPIRLAEALGRLSVENRSYALGYILFVFFVLPLLMILATRNLDVGYSASPPDIPHAVEDTSTTVAPADSLEAPPPAP